MKSSKIKQGEKENISWTNKRQEDNAKILNEDKWSKVRLYIE